jgi:hypothetical protein
VIAELKLDLETNLQAPGHLVRRRFREMMPYPLAACNALT